MKDILLKIEAKNARIQTKGPLAGSVAIPITAPDWTGSLMIWRPENEAGQLAGEWELRRQGKDGQLMLVDRNTIHYQHILHDIPKLVMRWAPVYVEIRGDGDNGNGNVEFGIPVRIRRPGQETEEGTLTLFLPDSGRDFGTWEITDNSNEAVNLNGLSKTAQMRFDRKARSCWRVWKKFEKLYGNDEINEDN